MYQATTISQSTASTAASLALKDVHAVDQLNGFKKGDRIAVTDAVASPPRVYGGEVGTVFSDGWAHVVFDHTPEPAAERNMKNNGRVNLHWAVHA